LPLGASRAQASRVQIDVMAAEALPATRRAPAQAAALENVLARGDDQARLLGIQTPFWRGFRA